MRPKLSFFLPTSTGDFLRIRTRQKMLLGKPCPVLPASFITSLGYEGDRMVMTLGVRTHGQAGRGLQQRPLLIEPMTEGDFDEVVADGR